MEDEPSEVLNKMALFSKRGYSFTTDDRKNRSINLHDVNEEIGRRSLLFGNVEMGQTSSNEEFVLSKINSINKMMEDEFRSMNCRLSLVEKENKELKDRVSKLENRHGVTSDENLHNEPVINTEPMVGTGSKSNEADQANDHFINEVSVSFGKLSSKSSSIHYRYSGMSSKILICLHRPTPSKMDETVTKPDEADHVKASEITEESIVQTTFEADEVVEIASCRKWFQAIVLKTDIRNGVEMVLVEYSTLFQDKKNKTKRIQKRIRRIRPLPPTGEPEEMKSLELMDSVEAYHNESWCSGRVRAIHSDDIYSVSLDRSTNFLQFSLSDLCIPKTWINGDWKTTKEGKTIVGKKRKATGPPVDHLPFLQPEEKRPIGPRNPPMPVTPEHIDAAFAMLNRKRIEQSTWFREKSLPKACFVPVHFLETVGYSFESLKTTPKKVIQILKGYGKTLLKGHYIGVEIHLLDNTITLFHCGLQKRGTRIENIPLVKKLAVLIPAIKLEIMNEEVNFKDIVPFQVKKAEKLPKTRFPCGIFVLKMLECKSFGLKKMLDINDDTTIDLRSKLCCDIFNHFMASDFE
ncbi:hypothetical protein Bca52824_016066 [Brassica carinata]|uniref:Agenet domain-containing protein n=1 Tax=Brassica carinata TaxID=52824 RepID=A0A8X8B602_BRACI|nr:hypothetical protein Bca52824_016066 [Brassica carinata]